MQFTRMILAATAIFTAYTCAAAVSGRSATALTKRDNNASEPALDPQVLSDLSSWFGWQLAGAAKDTNEIDAGCNKMNSSGGPQWAAIGLVPANIRQSLCNASGSSPDPQQALPNSIPFISAIIQRQLVGSFIGTDSFAYLCDHLAPLQIDQFYIGDAKLLNAVCQKGGKQVPPRPFGTDAGRPISEAAAFAAGNTASILYATLLAAGAESGLQLNTYCAHASDHIVNLNTEKLNGTLVESTLCEIKTLLQPNQARAKILSWTSQLFITVLENIGESEDWLSWLCEHLYVEGMNAVGLIGEGLKQQVCNDAKTGLPTAMPTGIPRNGTEVV